ncbi:MAG: glycine--tRNA ligase [Candidatus Tyloplasma litorale]|nr:MAG: glycine--tRNA ligase [Mycoplasmatales bacterium]
MKDTKEIISYLKDKGFVYSGSSIYGGLANSWDYGPLGAMLKDNIKNEWKKFFIDQEPEQIYHFDSGIILNSNVWKSSGHIAKFNDPMIDCKSCKSRYRADHLIEEKTNLNPDNLNFEEQTEIIHKKIKCPNCKKRDWTKVRSFELMFKTSNSKINNEDNLYLRPETAQGIFINFKNVINSLNPKIPFGIGQVGKSFRNEVTPGNFIFRTKEFEQLELEFFVKPEETEKWFDYFLNKIREFLLKLGLDKKNIKEFDVDKESLAHYSSKTIDFEYKFSFGWGEILGFANRGDFDLKNHSLNSNEKLNYSIANSNEKYYPHVLEISMGVERLFFALISELFIENKKREILKLPFSLAPYKVSIMPLTNKLNEEAKKLYNELLKKNIGPINFSTGGSIGKRYRKQDSIGTFFVITYDFDTAKDESVTIRNRDTMNQERILIKNINEYIKNNAK